jgi:hypothetical protein
MELIDSIPTAVKPEAHQSTIGWIEGETSEFPLIHG